MHTWIAAAVMIVTTLLMFQILTGKAVTSGLSLVVRHFDPVSFWGSLLQQCVAISLTAVITAAAWQIDWKKVHEATRPRRRG